MTSLAEQIAREASQSGEPVRRYYVNNMVKGFAFVSVMVFLSGIGIWIASIIEHNGMVGVAAIEWCNDPETVRRISHPGACKTFDCLSKLTEDNGKYVRICHPEALRS